MKDGIRNLKNGATVHAEFKLYAGHIVLCRWRENEWVTWKIDEEDNAYLGHYFSDDLARATADFLKRAIGETCGQVVCDNYLPGLARPQAE